MSKSESVNGQVFDQMLEPMHSAWTNSAFGFLTSITRETIVLWAGSDANDVVKEHNFFAAVFEESLVYSYWKIWDYL